MSCGLTSDELHLLEYLLKKRCLSEKHSKSVLAIERDMGGKIDVERAIRSLVNGGYLGRKKKKEMNYWAAAGRAIPVLREHGYRALPGRAAALEHVNESLQD